MITESLIWLVGTISFTIFAVIVIFYSVYVMWKESQESEPPPEELNHQEGN